MPTCIIILSDKSSGSSALQEFLCQKYGAKHITHTRHFEHETLYWVKAASILNLPQEPMQNSEVPIPYDTALSDVTNLLYKNLPEHPSTKDHYQMVMQGWRALVKHFSPVFVEKSPHHLHQRSALDLMIDFAETHPEVRVVFIGLVRNPIDTLYSMWTRFFSIPEDREVEWIRAYSNLIYLKNLNIPDMFIMRYEELRSNNERFAEFLDQVIPSDSGAVDFSFFHEASTKMHLQDPFFGYKPSPALAELAAEFGYTQQDLVTKDSALWPLWRGFRVRVLGTTFYIFAWLVRHLRALQSQLRQPFVR